MSTESMIRELFRGLETTLHERLSLIEQVLNTVEKPKIPLYDNEFVKRIERLEQQNQTRYSAPDTNMLEVRINALHDKLMQHSASDTSFLEARVNALEEQLASTCAELEMVKSRLKEPTNVNVHSPLPSVIGEEEAPEEVAEDEVAEEEEEAPEDDEGVDAEVLDDAEEGEALEEFQYRGVTYYKDGDNNVYTTDDEGALNPEPVARWTGTKLVRIVS